MNYKFPVEMNKTRPVLRSLLSNNLWEQKEDHVYRVKRDKYRFNHLIQSELKNLLCTEQSIKV